MHTKLCLCSGIVLSLLLSGCFLFGPKKDPKLVAKIDSAFQTQSTAVFDSPGWIPWAVGQWALIATEDGKGNRSLTEYAIIDQEGDAFWLQNVTTNPDRESEVQLLVEGYDAKNLKETVVRTMRWRDEKGEIHEHTRDADGEGGGILAMTMAVAMNAANSTLASLQQTEAEGVREDLQVPAGKFVGAKKTPVSYKFPMGSGTGHIWYAPVPVINFVQQVVNVTAMGFGAGESKGVLIDSGATGARRRF